MLSVMYLTSASVPRKRDDECCGCEAGVRPLSVLLPCMSNVPLPKRIFVVMWSLDAQPLFHLELYYAIDTRCFVADLPSSGMIFAQSLTVVLIPARLVAISIILIHIHLLGILLQVGHVVSSMPTLENSIRSL